MSERVTASTAEQIQSLPWVATVSTTARDEATHIVKTRCTVINRDDEVHTLENLRATVEAFTTTHGYGTGVYVSL